MDRLDYGCALNEVVEDPIAREAPIKNVSGEKMKR
jgi:hypothetical protein